MTEDWISLNLQQYFNSRNEKVQIFNVSNYKVGQNLIVNRFRSLNNKIDFNWLNESLNSFKAKCKKTSFAVTLKSGQYHNLHDSCMTNHS